MDDINQTNIKDLLMGHKKIGKLEKVFIENLNVYINLMKQINLIQPGLYIGSILKESICWVIGNLEHSMHDGKIRFYDLKWYENTLRIRRIGFREETLIIIDLIRNRLFHGDSFDNIQIYVSGVNNAQL